MTYKMLRSCLIGFISCTGLLFFQPARGQYNFSEFETSLLSRQKLMGKDAVVMIWKDDSLIYKKELGEFNSKTQAPIASSSKWLTAALIMVLVDEGKFSLDDPVVKYLPVFEKYGKNYITIRHCLSHMTGIEDEGNLIKKLLQRKKFMTLEEEINAFAAREIRANPGTDFWYGNVGLNIAARVAEVVAKKKFDQLIKQKLFNPLGMKKTTFSNPEGGAVNPSGGAQSTADDYMRFLSMLLNKGQVNGKQVLSEKSITELLTMQTKSGLIKYAPKSAEGFNYALGNWALDNEVFASPGLFGTWPMIDFSRGYAYLFFVKNFLGEQRADAQLDLKKIIDKQIPKN